MFNPMSNNGKVAPAKDENNYYSGPNASDTVANDSAAEQSEKQKKAFQDGAQGASLGWQFYQDYKAIDDIDVNAANPYQRYNIETMPDPYVRNTMPAELQAGTGLKGAAEYGHKGASLGMQAAGPWGALVGGVLGVAGGAVLGGKIRKKREAWERRQEELYGRWAGAVQQHQTYQRGQDMDLAKRREQGRRSTNTLPYFNQSIYGM